MLGAIFSILVIGLVILFFVSLFLFIGRLSRNGEMSKEAAVQNGEMLKRIMEQNERLISLLEENNMTE